MSTVDVTDEWAVETIKKNRLVLSLDGETLERRSPLQRELRQQVSLEAFAGGVDGEYKATRQLKQSDGTWADAVPAYTFDPDSAASATNVAFPVHELNDTANLEGIVVEIFYVKDIDVAGRWVFLDG